MRRKFTIYNLQWTIIFFVILFILSIFHFPLSITFAQSACPPGTVPRAQGLITTPSLSGKFGTTGACVVDPKAAFAPFKIPTFADLLSLYFTQKASILCISDSSCSAPAPSCGQTTSGVDNCSKACTKVGPACVPPPTADLKADNSNGPITISHNTAVNLTWSSTNNPTCTASGSWSGPKPNSGSETTGNLAGPATRTFTLTCSNSSGSTADSVTVNVSPPLPTVDLKANNSDGPVTIGHNFYASLSWSSTNALSGCSASGDWSGAKNSSDSNVSTGILAGPKTYTFTLTCSNSTGSKSDSVTVNVSAPLTPSVTTQAASGVTTTLATLNSAINPNGSPTDGWYKYTNINYGNNCDNYPDRAFNRTSANALGSGSSPVNNPISIANLTPGTTYYFCAVATSGSGRTSGSVMTFTTAAPTPPPTTRPQPVVTTQAASNITKNSATLNSTTIPNGSATTGWYNFGTSNTNCASLGNQNSTGTVSLGSGSSGITNPMGISGLNPSTTYYFCAVANNPGGTSYGSILSFTAAPPPQQSSNPPTIVGEGGRMSGNTAQFNSIVNPNGLATSVRYRYNFWANPCPSVPGLTSSTAIGSGTSPVASNNSVDIQYDCRDVYFCTEAQNSSGTTYADVFFIGSTFCPSSGGGSDN